MWQDILKIWARYSGVYWEGLLGTLWIAALTVLLGTVLGTLLAVLRLSRSRVGQGLAGFYIWIIRGTPVLLQLYFFYLLLPKVLPVQIGETESVMTALVINASAYVSEIIRAGIQAVDAGQAEAASCLGLNRRQTLRFIILPQAVKNVLPALANEVVTMVKESSVCSAYGMGELMFAAKNVSGTTLISVGPFVFIALIYFCINFPASKAIEAIERRMRRGDKR